MNRVFWRVLSLMGLLALLSPPAALAARPHVSGKTIRNLSETLPLGVLERSVGPKFYRSLLASPLDDWSVIRAQATGRGLSRPRVIRPAANPAYNALALKFASELTLVANERGKRVPPSDSALMHLLIYKIADGLMAVSFAHPETVADQQMKNVGHIRLSVKKSGEAWTEITASETHEEKRSSLHERGRRLRRMDRMPMDAITIPGR